MKGIVALMMALVTAPALAADQFDLVCRGTVKFGFDRPIETTVHYRVDLAAKAWCVGECVAVEQIDKVEPGRIVFREQRPELRRDPVIIETVDRATGKWSSVYSGRGFGNQTEYEGVCEAKAFTGFPAPKF